MSTDIRVALIYEQDAGTQVLRTALANAGVTVALECRASALDSTAILATEVDAIVVNLDAELEELLDEVTEALDAATQPVIYNDPAASSDLSGWDRARWMRHLSAKLKGQSNVTPPAPPGAQAIPMPAAKPVEAPAPAAVVSATVPMASAAPEPVPSEIPGPAHDTVPDVGMDLGFGDLDLMFDGASNDIGGNAAPEQDEQTTEAAAAPTGDFLELDVADLDLMFESPATPAESPHAQFPDTADVEAAGVVASHAAGEPGDFDLADLDSMFDDAPRNEPVEAPERRPSLVVGEDIVDLDNLFDSAPEPAEPADHRARGPAMADTVELELDSLFIESGASDTARLPETVATSAELTDLDALFREFEAGQKAGDAAPAEDSSSSAPAKPSAQPAKRIEARSAPLEWSLEPVEVELPKGPQGDRLINEWRLEAPAKPLAQMPAEPVAAAPTKVASSPVIPEALDASLALADLKLLDEVEPLAVQPAAAKPADLDQFDLSSLDLESIEPSTSPPGADAVDFGDQLSLADLDFDLGPGPMDHAAGVDAASQDRLDADLDDLDSLFEPIATTAPAGLALSDLDRVFVLGASIGGPEAIKLFLSHLPESVPAAFIVAQHMGSEFLEMMAVQLDAASKLPVRCAKAGERLRHGEVVVAPAQEQLVIDEGGHIRLSAAASGSPYSPSIDHLVRAAADRFGDHATLILFSGMGSDGVEGGRYLTSCGGQVWSQDRASCVIASMIDSAKSQGLVRFEGTPALLAERVLQVVS